MQPVSEKSVPLNVILTRAFTSCWENRASCCFVSNGLTVYGRRGAL